MADPLLGRHLGRYELRALLGAGGMARVYSAFDPILERDVALKVLHSFVQQQADFAERFRHEAQILASLRHPNIVQIYDYGEQDDLSFIVQQLQSGPTLEQELAALATQGCLMERASVEQVIMQLADALDYAHSRKFIHRDLKPSNIIRNERGDVVLTDFGIAKVLTATLTNTQTGWVLGTPAYLSPEQARGSPSLSVASDIYTLGVILFELLTGQVPFNDPRPMEVLLGHIQQVPPSPRSLRPTLPATVEHVVLKALAKDPAVRYASAGALVRAFITSWPATTVQSIHSQPTVMNLTPRMAGGPSAVAGAVVPQPVHNPPAMANPPTIIASSPRTPPVSALRPAWQRHVRTGFALMSFPALLMIVVALFFIGLPAERRFGTTPTPTLKATEAAGALGFTTTAPEPTFTTTPQPTLTTTPQPTFTTTSQPTFTTTPQPTLTTTSQPTLTTTPQPTLIPTMPATVPPIPPQPPPQPTFNAVDFW
jgi:eukaryotic-like serine/threonine-protein kinase